MSSQLDSLEHQREKLDRQIDVEMMNLLDRLRLRELKRRKLRRKQRIKDEIHRLLWSQREGARHFKSGFFRPKQQ